ncbi:MAG: hypothetical protein ACREEW_05935 [Caulobacteraceae bacterium]
MILRRILFALAGATALAVSAGVFVVALAYMLYALVKPEVGAPAASAVVAGAAAIVIGLLAVALGALARPKKRKPGEPKHLVDRLVEFVRAKPVTAIASAVAAGLLAVRNPTYLGAVLRAFVDDGRRKRG